MFRAQRSRWLLFGALVLALVRMPASRAARQNPDPAPTASDPLLDAAPRRPRRDRPRRSRCGDGVAMRRLWIGLLVAAAYACVPATAAAAPSIVVECNGTSTCEGPDVWFRTPVFVDWTVSGGIAVGGLPGHHARP